MNDILFRHREIWKRKKILRTIYEEWYKRIVSDLHKSDKKTIELGGGGGNFKEYYPDVVSADIEDREWLDMTFDAHRMPFENESVSNLVMLDVLHHLQNPVLFLYEAVRVLEKKGRLIMLEPYPSPFSIIVYKIFHPEPFDFRVDYFSKTELEEKHPWESNQAIPYLIFYKHIKKFNELFSDKFNIFRKEKLSFIVYPLSGGFENQSLIPEKMINFSMKVEKLLHPFRDLKAFRCYIVLEKK